MKTYIIDKSKAKLLAFLFVAALLIVLTGCESEVKKSYNMNISATIGYDGVVSIRDGNPVEFVIDNKGGDFSGEIEIDLPIDNNYKKILSIPFEISANTEKKLVSYVHYATVSKKINYRVVSDGVVYKTGIIFANKVISPSMYVIGLVTDYPDNYSSLKALEKNFVTLSPRYREQYDEDYIAESTKEAEALYRVGDVAKLTRILDKGTLTNANALAYFDYIYIGENTSLSLSDTSSLEAWVNNGGNLIIEAGKNYKKVFKYVPENLVLIDNYRIEEIEVRSDMLMKDGKEPSTGVVEFLVGEPKRDTVKVINNGQLNLGYVEKMGQGRVIMLNTILSSDQLSKWNKDGSYFNEVIYLADNLSPDSSDIEEKRGFQTRRFRWRSQYIPTYLLPSLKLFALLLIVYILVVGPVLYSVLKKKDKSVYLWIATPVLSVVVLVVIFLVGNPQLSEAPLFNEISLIKYNSETNVMTIDSLLNVFNDKSGDVDIEFQRNAGVSPTRRFHDGRYYRAVDEDRETRYKYQLGDTEKYTYYGIGKWQGVQFKGSKVINLEEQGVEAKLEKVDNKDVVTLKNNLPIDIKYASLFVNGSVYEIGYIKSNEEYTYRLDSLKEEHFSHISFSNEKEDQEKNFYYQTVDGDVAYNIRSENKFDQISILGFTSDTAGYRLNINGRNAKPITRNIIWINVKVPLSSGREVTINSSAVETKSKAFMSRNDVSTENDDFMMLGFGDTDDLGDGIVLSTEFIRQASYNAIETEFTLPPEIEVSDVSVDFNMNFEYTLEERTNQLQEQYFIFNYKNGDFEEVKFDGKTVLDDKKYVVNLDEMVGPNNEIKIRVVKLFDKINPKPERYHVKKNEIEIKGVIK